MTQEDLRDQIYAQPLSAITDFRFDDAVARVFPDMINRSVPGYSTLINMLGVLANYYARNDSAIYDLGCSLGAASLSIRHHLHKSGCHIIAVDNSEAMIERARSLMQVDQSETPVKLICADIRDVEIRNASVVVLNFTLQFLQPQERLSIIRTIYDGLKPGGVLILSEKIRLPDPQQDERLIDLHHEFKKANGYSDLEISQKRTALEKVLIPETVEQHTSRLKKAGFSVVDVWYQCFNFVSMLARKS
jgi:tRNA (cmo5U34)-methyltransferase